MSVDDLDVDVAVVGYGPVGQALSALLGRAGHRVVAFERCAEIHRLPRAVHLDHEIMRLLQSLDLADLVAQEMVVVDDDWWFGADRRPLLRSSADPPARSGWASDYMFFQPELEAAIHRQACPPAGVTVARGWLAEDVEDWGGHVGLTASEVRGDASGELVRTGQQRRVRARFVVAADGADSLVRRTRAIKCRDLGFAQRWLVVDAEPHDMDALALPIVGHYGDPARPTTLVRSGPRHRRWEFMLLEGEEPSDFEEPERIWALLAPWCRPRDATLTHAAVYEFRSLLADEMRKGSVLIVGDAAHLMPPFLGQGLCCGLRDAANVAWKLDLVLRGLADERLLDTVTPERQGQNEAVVRLAIELGEVLCEHDAVRAAQRDRTLRSAGSPPPLELAPLTIGVIHQPIGEPDPVAGTLSVQGVVEYGGREGLFDDIVGRGFQLIVAAGDPLAGLSHRERTALETLGAVVASLDPAAEHGVRDCDGRLTAWLREHNAHAVLIRPDFYVFGAAATPRGVPELVADLCSRLHLTPIAKISEAPE